MLLMLLILSCIRLLVLYFVRHVFPSSLRACSL
jgi:hypothetical protein